MIDKIVKAINSNIGQILLFALNILSFLITVRTLQFVSTIRKKIKDSKKKALCLKSLKEISGILRKNASNWLNNPSDIDNRIICTNEQVIRNISFSKKLYMIIVLRKQLVNKKEYLHFLKIYDEIIIDMEREEI